jgi:hypothetical protein
LYYLSARGNRQIINLISITFCPTLWAHYTISEKHYDCGTPKILDLVKTYGAL